VVVGDGESEFGSKSLKAPLFRSFPALGQTSCGATEKDDGAGRKVAMQALGAATPRIRKPAPIKKEKRDMEHYWEPCVRRSRLLVVVFKGCRATGESLITFDSDAAVSEDLTPPQRRDKTRSSEQVTDIQRLQDRESVALD
jgi:hypothetical protein